MKFHPEIEIIVAKINFQCFLLSPGEGLIPVGWSGVKQNDFRVPETNLKFKQLREAREPVFAAYDRVSDLQPCPNIPRARSLDR